MNITFFALVLLICGVAHACMTGIPGPTGHPDELNEDWEFQWAHAPRYDMPHMTDLVRCNETFPCKIANVTAAAETMRNITWREITFPSRSFAPIPPNTTEFHRTVGSESKYISLLALLSVTMQTVQALQKEVDDLKALFLATADPEKFIAFHHQPCVRLRLTDSCRATLGDGDSCAYVCDPRKAAVYEEPEEESHEAVIE